MTERLQKYLARAGVASRRHAEELITAGRVTVNNQKVTEMGSRVEPGDLVTVDGQLVSPPEKTSYYLLYKPVGVVTTLSDPQGRPTVANYLEETGKRLFPVGRLDYDAEGALLFTDDGALAHKLTHPSFQVPRSYLAKVKGVPDQATLGKLRGGVRLEDGIATPVSVDVFEAAERNTWLKIVVAEGRPHLIKRLCAAVGHPVVRLYRPSYAGISVEGLRPGQLRPLTATEVRTLEDVSEGRAEAADVKPKLPPRRHGRAAPGFDDDMDEGFDEDEAPVRRPPARKAAAAPASALGSAKRAPAKRAERPERAERKPMREGGTGLARFGRTGAGGAGEERSARPARKEWSPREEEGGRPERKAFSPRGEEGGRPERREWKPRAEGAGRPERKSFSPRGEEGGRPERKAFRPRGEEGGRPERREWKPRGEGAGAGRPERKAFSPRGEEGGRPERREWKPRAEGAGRPERKAFSPRGEEGGRPERREWKPRAEGAGRPERKSFSPRGEEGGRPERREWKPRGEGAGAGRPERREWKPRGEGDAPRGRGFSGGAGRPERREWKPRGEVAGAGRPERGARPARKEAGEGRPSGFQDWSKKKERGTGAQWSSRPPRGGAGPKPRGGPRRPR